MGPKDLRACRREARHPNASADRKHSWPLADGIELWRTHKPVHGAVILQLEVAMEFSALLDHGLRSEDCITPTSVQLVVGALLRGHPSSNRSHVYSALLQGDPLKRHAPYYCLAEDKLEIARLEVSTVLCYGRV